MRLSHFFIDRPIFAAVVSIVFVIVGAVSVGRLPVAQYPEIAPPVVRVDEAVAVIDQRRHLGEQRNLLSVERERVTGGEFGCRGLFTLSHGMTLLVEVESGLCFSHLPGSLSAVRPPPKSCFSETRFKLQPSPQCCSRLGMNFATPGSRRVGRS